MFNPGPSHLWDQASGLRCNKLPHLVSRQATGSRTHVLFFNTDHIALVQYLRRRRGDTLLRRAGQHSSLAVEHAIVERDRTPIYDNVWLRHLSFSILSDLSCFSGSFVRW